MISKAVVTASIIEGVTTKGEPCAEVNLNFKKKRDFSATLLGFGLDLCEEITASRLRPK